MFTRDHIIGFAVGLGAAAVGFYFYKQHQSEVDSFLAGKGIHLPGETQATGGSLQDMVAQKERLEDLIAEQESQSA